MRLAEIERLRCPFCGNPFAVEPDGVHTDGEFTCGVLFCQCCAYPVVDGIPYLQTGDFAKRLLALLKSGTSDARARNEQALDLLLIGGARPETFQEAIELFSPTLEGAYFFHRFSDPTFVISDLLLRALGGAGERVFKGPVLDACGGTGHLTRTLAGLSSGPVWLADLHYWKIWVARRFLAPGCVAVCCDAANPLPFESAMFSLVFCSGAFEYIWPRRLFAEEMIRAATREGAVLVTHTHNALCENPSPGMPLTPQGYRHLFASHPVRLYPESAILEAFVRSAPVDLSTHWPPDELKKEPALFMISSSREELFRIYTPPKAAVHSGELAINPLYKVERNGAFLSLDLKFPSEFYGNEFSECMRYLPAYAAVSCEQFTRWQSGDWDDLAREWLHRRMLLDLPHRYR
jgi:SAM-dependent methyltransferase/uncharacterized protein YbaR (Trm112 family)